MLRVLTNLLIVRRPEFLIVEITIFAMPLLLTVGDPRELCSWVVAEGAILFFVLFSMGDMINCLADRELDKTYKGHLSRAVYGLGPGVLRDIVIVEAVLALVIAMHLSWYTGRWSLLGLVLSGMFLGIEYSVGPFHFKSRGVGHLICLWLLLYFLPMLYSALLVTKSLSWAVIALATAYATVEMGIILINTSEDLPEDLAMGIRTTTVALGLKRTIWLATGMVFTGALRSSWYGESSSPESCQSTRRSP